MATLKKTMFREYDIRGRESEEELNNESVYHIACGFGAFLKARSISEVIVGHDARLTSKDFHAQMIKGLLESGVNIVDIGEVTTPMSYWAQYHFNVAGLAMITASHNPTGWNGMKLGTAPSKTLLSDEIKELYGMIEREEYVTGSGTLRSESGVPAAYIADLVGRIHLARPMKVLVNTGNGTAGLFVPALLKKAGCEVVERYTDVDTTYPHYTANPDGTAMMEDTGSQTVEHGCEVGLAFDGDGDRLGVTDENGTTVWPDRYLILLSRAVLQEEPGAKIVFDVKVSEALPEDIASHGGIPVMWKTGHSYIKAKLQSEQAALAGEMSGHIFFAQDFYGFDDAFFAALKLLEYLSQQSDPLSKVIEGTPYYVSTPTIQVQTTDEDKYGIVESLVASFKAEGYKMIDVNGARVYTSDGWGLVRASSNTPSLVLRFESRSEDGLGRIQELFRGKLSQYPSVSTHWDSSGH